MLNIKNSNTKGTVRLKMVKSITFKYAPDNSMLLPIIPAAKGLPDWYKNTPETCPDSMPWEPGTFKGCMPFLDAMTQGYIIPLWADLYVDSVYDEEQETFVPTFTWTPGSKPSIETHSPQQVEHMPGMKESTGGNTAFKFINPWIIETPKGYSSLFVPPINQENSQFKAISAIVSTDMYPHQVALPFIWTAPSGWTGVLTRGTPIIQVIPFKRDDFKHDIREMSLKEQNMQQSTMHALNSTFKGGYKKLFRRRSSSI
jgi:hypothetical protein